MWLIRGIKKQTGRQTHITGLTSRERELDLFVNDFQGYEVMSLIESAIVEKQSVSFSRRKPADRYISEVLFEKRKKIVVKRTNIQIRVIENMIETYLFFKPVCFPVPFLSPPPAPKTLQYKDRGPPEKK